MKSAMVWVSLVLGLASVFVAYMVFQTPYDLTGVLALLLLLMLAASVYSVSGTRSDANSAWTSLIFGFLSAALSVLVVWADVHGPPPGDWFPVGFALSVWAVWLASIIPGVVAVIIGLLALRRRTTKRAAAIAGMILGLSPAVVALAFERLWLLRH